MSIAATLPSVEIISEQSLLIRFSESIHLDNIAIIQSTKQAISAALGNAMTDSISAYTTLLIQTNPLLVSPWQAQEIINNTLADSQLSTDSHSQASIELPVYYHPSVARDLIATATQLGLTWQQLADKHSRQRYHVFALGFSPGFAFMGELPSELQLPRKAAPAKKVPAGAVAIAAQQTAIYPSESPGGWHIIGRCPSQLFNSNQQPPNLLQVGQVVSFKAISRAEYIALGGEFDDEEDRHD